MRTRIRFVVVTYSRTCSPFRDLGGATTSPDTAANAERHPVRNPWPALRRFPSAEDAVECRIHGIDDLIEIITVRDESRTQA